MCLFCGFSSMLKRQYKKILILYFLPNSYGLLLTHRDPRDEFWYKFHRPTGTQEIYSNIDLMDPQGPTRYIQIQILWTHGNPRDFSGPKGTHGVYSNISLIDPRPPKATHGDPRAPTIFLTPTWFSTIKIGSSKTQLTWYNHRWIW